MKASRCLSTSSRIRRLRMRHAPRDSDGLSLIRGRLSTQSAAQYVRRTKWAYRGDGVRYTTVGALREAGFRVKATPSRRNPIHVSVCYETEWTDDVTSAFNACFDDIGDTWTGGESDE